MKKIKKIKNLKDYKVSSWKINHLDLDFTITESVIKVISKFTCNKRDKTINSLELDGENLKLLSLEIDDKVTSPKNYKLEKEKLIIHNLPNSSYRFKIKNEIAIKKNKSLTCVCYTKNTIYTRCEPEGFREITYFIDKPENFVTFTSKITAPKEFIHLLSNGELVKKGIKKNQHWVIWEDLIPKPCYLFSLVIGNFHSQEVKYVSKKGKDIKIEIFVSHKFKDYCDIALDSIKQAMQYDDEVFGLKYDYNLYQMVVLEGCDLKPVVSKGLSILNILYLTNYKIFIDEEYIKINNTIANIYFQNLVGSRFGIENWFNLSLKEGLCTFREQEYSAARFTDIFQRISDVRKYKTTQILESKGKLSRPVLLYSYMEIRNYYNSSVYLKAAEIIRMLSIILGKNNFQEILQKFIKKYDKKPTTIKNFLEVVQSYTKKNLNHFSNWYTTSQNPKLKILDYYNYYQKTYRLFVFQIDENEMKAGKEYNWDYFVNRFKDKKYKYLPLINTKEEKNISSSVLETYPLVKEPFYIPLEITFIDKSGGGLIYVDLEKGKKTKVLKLNTPYQEFLFNDISQKPLPSFNRGFSAPIEIDYDYSLNDLSILSYREENFTSRWQASFEVFIRIIKTQIFRYLDDKVLYTEDEFVTSLQKNITSPSLKKDFIYHILNLPTEMEIFNQIEIKSPESIHYVRSYLAESIAKKLEKNFISLYQQNELDFEFSLEKNEISKRLIRNKCLYYIARTENGMDLVMNNYTDNKRVCNYIGSLEAVNDLDCPEREKLMQMAYKKWKYNKILMNKWFVLQAQSARDNTLDYLEEIVTKHPEFSFHKNYLVSNLFETFAFQNSYCFHHISGRGYDFLTNNILKIDELNPQITARLVSAFDNYKQLNIIRREAIENCLNKILAKKKISTNLFEVTNKILDK